MGGEKREKNLRTSTEPSNDPSEGIPDVTRAPWQPVIPAFHDIEGPRVSAAGR